MKTSLRLLSVILIASTLWIACKKEATKTSSAQTSTEQVSGIAANTTFSGSISLAESVTYCGTGTTKDLCAGQSIKMGTVTFNNDVNGNVYITYTATGNWYFTELHLWVGSDCSGVPVNKAGQPVPGQFPYKVTFSSPYTVQTYTFKISGLIGDCFCVAAHSAVVQIVNGQIIQSQTAWGDGCDGTRISPKGNWGTRFTACISRKCDPPVPTGCALSQGYWFATGNGNTEGHAWPAPATVTVGGKTYTEAEGKAIWNASSSQSDGKHGFTQVAALRLSVANGTLTGIPAALQAYVDLIDNFLSSKDKLTPANCGDAMYNDSSVATAAGAIGDWIDEHHCE